MTSLFWFMLGCWLGCAGGFLLFAAMQIMRDGDRVADAALDNAVRRAEPGSKRYDGRRQANHQRVKRIHVHAW
jgi:hypothetical protein